MSNIKKIPFRLAFVSPRFGQSIGGGAETLLRQHVLQLQGKVENLEVITTCAKDHRTWDNFYPPGVSIEDGIKVHRFPVSERNIDIFLHHEIRLSQGHKLSTEDQIQWLENGVNSIELYDHLLKIKDNYDYIFFAPYLFPITIFGSLLTREKSIIFPCLHDEKYAYLEIIRYMLEQCRGIMWNALPEMQLAQKIYPHLSISNKSSIIGMGFDLPKSTDNENTKRQNPYMLYCGRKEQGKNLDLLLDYFEEYTSHFSNSLELVLIGSGTIDFRENLPQKVIDLGYVSVEEKYSLMKDATILCQPSVNESFSIVMMEAWLRETPVLVHGSGAVTSYHTTESKGGMTFTTQDDFNTALEKIQNTSFAKELGSKGYNYVVSKYSWENVQKLFVKSLYKLEQNQTSRSKQT